MSRAQIGQLFKRPDATVRLARALWEMGVRLKMVCALTETEERTVAGWVARKKRFRDDAGEPTQADFLRAGDVAARWAIEKRLR